MIVLDSFWCAGYAQSVLHVLGEVFLYYEIVTAHFGQSTFGYLVLACIGGMTVQYD